MLKLVWTPGPVQVPSDPAYLATQDVLRQDSGSGPLLQTLSRIDLNAVNPPTPVPGPALADALNVWLNKRQRDRIVVMVHGFSYDPSGKIGGGTDDPFSLVYGTPGAKLDYHNSWLPIVGECTDQGVPLDADLAIAFAWTSEGSFLQYANVGWNNAYQYAVFDLAPLAARTLAAVLSYLRQNSPAPVDVFAHSLGTRAVDLAFRSLAPAAQDAAFGKLVLLGGAEYGVDANAHLTSRPFQVFNIASRIDEVLSLGGQQFGHPVRFNGSDAARVIGRDGLKPLPNWLDIQLDRDEVATWFKNQGYAISASHHDGQHSLAWMNHWAYYMNDGNRAFLADLLAKPEMSIDWFRGKGLPQGIDAEYYGNFNPAIPPTPTTLDGRRRDPSLPDDIV